MRFPKTLLSLLLSATLFTQAHAGGFTLVPGAPLQQSVPLEVKGRNGILIKQKLSFGDYQTAFVKRGWIREWSGATGFPNEIWVKTTEGKQSIRFALASGGDTAEAIATTHVERNQLVFGNDPNNLPSIVTDVLTIGTDLQQNNLSVAVQLRKDSKPWELFLDNEAAQLHRTNAAGYLRQGDVVYTIHPVWRVRSRKGKEADMPFGAVGLEFRNSAGEAVAAVNLMDNGAVHLNEASPAPEKLLLSTACAALLLQSVI